MTVRLGLEKQMIYLEYKGQDGGKGLYQKDIILMELGIAESLNDTIPRYKILSLT